jgi:hypothetical protein
MSEFTEEICDIIRHIISLIQIFENNNRVDDVYLFSIPFSHNIKYLIDKRINIILNELYGSHLVHNTAHSIILKIQKTYLYIDYGFNVDKDDNVNCEFYLTIKGKGKKLS